ncbi:MAG: hypothetical protein IJ634_04845 [Bacteroidales bacterium]|nr:hypothetical protein [Bacteroidales bacterium]
MKHLALFTALLATLFALAACHPEEQETLRHIAYTVDDAAEQHVTTRTEAEFNALLEQFCHYAEEGSTVTFHGAPASRRHKPAGIQPSKDATTYSTTSRDEIKAWMRDMEAAGMTVTVTYDSETGTWNGTAYANAQQPRGVATFVNLADPNYNGPTVFVTIDSLNRTAYVNFDNEHYSQWHIPVGIFDGIWQYDDIHLILHTDNGDTLCLNHLMGDTMLLRLYPAAPCRTLHEHSIVVTRAPQEWQTWYSDQVGGIVLNVLPNVIETYPEIHLGQICAPGAYLINCPCPIVTGSCELQRYYTDLPDIDWELSLRYSYINDSSYYRVDSLGLSGDFLLDRTVTLHDLRQFPGCASQYIFNRVN